MIYHLLQVLLRASPSKLVEQLVEDTSSADPNYIEDFLLCHRFTFPSATEIEKRNEIGFQNPVLGSSWIAAWRWCASCFLGSRAQTWETGSLGFFCSGYFPLNTFESPWVTNIMQVNNHFTDFELDSDMMELLDGFESRLESAKMQVPRITFYQIICSLIRLHN